MDGMENTKNLVTLVNLPCPKNRPTMTIKPKVFMLTFKLTHAQVQEAREKIGEMMTASISEAQTDLLRGLCTQTLQFRKESRESVYPMFHIILENITSRYVKGQLLKCLESILSMPVATAEVVNGNLAWAKLYKTSTWGQVETVLMKSVEKETLELIQQGEELESIIYNESCDIVKLSLIHI